MPEFTVRFIDPAKLIAVHAVTAGEIGYSPPTARKRPKRVTPVRCSYRTLAIITMNPIMAMRLGSNTDSMR